MAHNTAANDDWLIYILLKKCQGLNPKLVASWGLTVLAPKLVSSNVTGALLVNVKSTKKAVPLIAKVGIFKTVPLRKAALVVSPPLVSAAAAKLNVTGSLPIFKLRSTENCKVPTTTTGIFITVPSRVAA